MFIPYRANVDVLAKPITIYLIIALNLLFYLAVTLGVSDKAAFASDGFNIHLISSAFMHADLFHLFFNMYYLYLFGIPVCAKVGNATFPLIYFILILVSSIAHQVFDGAPAIGASGAVSGAIGMYLYLYPKSDIRCMWTVIWAWGKTFSIAAFWLIGFWIIRDFFGALYGTAPIAYTAHLGGFFAGIALGWSVVKLNWIKRECDEPNLSDVLK